MPLGEGSLWLMGTWVSLLYQEDKFPTQTQTLQSLMLLHFLITCQSCHILSSLIWSSISSAIWMTQMWPPPPSPWPWPQCKPQYFSCSSFPTSPCPQAHSTTTSLPIVLYTTVRKIFLNHKFYVTFLLITLQWFLIIFSIKFKWLDMAQKAS